MGVIKVFDRAVAVGDALFINDSTGAKVWKRPSELQQEGMPAGHTFAAVAFNRRGRKVKVLEKTAATLKYADVVQMDITGISSTNVTIRLRMAGDYATDVAVSVTLASTGITAANAAAISDALNAAGNAGNTGYAAHKWWAYMANADNELVTTGGVKIIVQCDNWNDYRQYIVSGTGCTISHQTWRGVAESSSYKKKTGATTNYRGIMNTARGVAYWSTNGRTPTSDEPLIKSGNDNPVTRAAFETNAYCKLLRETYDSYETYIRENWGVMYPQQYGCFALPDGKTLTTAANYGARTVPTKDGGTKAAMPAMNRCLTIDYGVDGLRAGDWWLPGVTEGVELMKDDVLAKVAATMRLCGGAVPTNSSYRWYAQRCNVHYAWFFSGGYGNLYTNNVVNGFQVQAVALLET